MPPREDWLSYRLIEHSVRASVSASRENWLGNRVFASCENIVGQCCRAWNNLIERPWKIMSIGLRDWRIGYDQRPLV